MSVYLCNYLIFNVLQFVKKQISFLLFKNSLYLCSGRKKSSDYFFYIMNRIFIPNFQACNKAVIEFSRKEKINIRTSDKFYLANPNFASTPWPFAGLPIAFVCYDKQGKALYAGMSKNSTGQNNFIKVDSVTGEGVEKVPWPMGKPHHLVFYCLSDHALDGDDKLYRQMLELRRCLRKTIKECTTTPTWSSVAQLLKQVSVSNICRHLTWISPRQIEKLEFWHNLLSDDNGKTLVTDIETYYLQVSTLDFGSTLPKIDINMVIRNTDDMDCFIPLDKNVKDYALISRLPVYTENPEAEPWQTALNIILRVSGILLDPDD